MMVLEIGGGTLFGSLALVSDGLHMATHVVAILIAALAYRFARQHSSDRRFTFGTGKVGDLAGFSSAIILAMIAALVAYEAVARFFQPVTIHFSEAIPIAVLGLCVNVASAWLLSGPGGHHHDHHQHEHDDPDEHDHPHEHDDHHRHGRHADEHEGALDPNHATHRDHNFRSAFVHVMGDAAVSVLAIVGLLLAKYLGWIWMDPMMGLIGATVIAAWAYSLVRDTTRVLVDFTPDVELESRIRHQIEAEGDSVTDLHLWRLGPGHLGAIVSVATVHDRDSDFYKDRLRRFQHLSHVTVEVVPEVEVGAR